MSRARAKRDSPGWASFDLRQRQKQGLDNEVDKDPFPPLTTTLPSLHQLEKLQNMNNLPETSFSSVVLPSKGFPTSLDNVNGKVSIVNDSSSIFPGIFNQKKHSSTVKELKELYTWADKNLIEDVLENLNNNVNEASAFLKAMVAGDSGDSFEKNNREDQPRFCNIKTSSYDQINAPSETTEEIGDLTNFENSHELGPAEMIINEGGLTHSASATEKPALGYFIGAPIEPEWEEDDMYLSHRKNALAMMRSASRHSRAATNAFIRGDHLAAHKHSFKSQEEWLEAKRLNDKAAKEILAVRNSKNDKWKLDLHGLHAGEAVQALQEHLEKIEIPEQFDHLISPIKDSTNENLGSSHETMRFKDMEKYKKQSSTRKIASSLQVITGIGNHSRGEAALPKAVTSFLSENGYRFEESRPGVIMVRPKFRR